MHPGYLYEKRNKKQETSGGLPILVSKGTSYGMELMKGVVPI